MPTTEPIYIGIDLGTGGVRAVAVTGNGRILAEDSLNLPADAVKQSGDLHEQDASAWWAITQTVVRNIVSKLKDNHLDAGLIEAIAVDGTSGTIVPLSAGGQPLRWALMYNDGRAVDEANELTERAHTAGSDVTIASSYAIARIRWLEKHEPNLFAGTHRFAHQADFIQSRLLNESVQMGEGDDQLATTASHTPQASNLKPFTTDYSNALKTGYDLIHERWPEWLTSMDGITRRLPDVVAPGTCVGTISSDVAHRLDLPAHVKIITGCSDGTAGFLACGAKNLGDDNTTLGTTFVFKRIADESLNNELIYSHKLPGGRWLPGAASNTGGEWIRRQFPDVDLAALDAEARKLLPIDVLAYPLARTGERFPFNSADAFAFIEPDVKNEVEHYAAMLQGTALFERLCYEKLNQETGIDEASIGDVYATGGGAKSDVWLQLRANVTGRTYHVPAYPESAFGAAILAATGATNQPLWETIGRMVRIDRTFEPDPSESAIYDRLFEQFKAALHRRGWL